MSKYWKRINYGKKWHNIEKDGGKFVWSACLKGRNPLEEKEEKRRRRRRLFLIERRQLFVRRRETLNIETCV